MPELERSIALVKLAPENKRWLNTLVHWQHDEWLRQRVSPLSLDEANEAYLKRKALLATHLDSQDFPCTLIAHEANQPIGCASIVTYFFSNATKPTYWVTNVFVLPVFRSQGIATALLEGLEVHAKSSGLTRLFLSTRDQKAFYLKRNWNFLHLYKDGDQDASVLVRNL